MTDDRIRSRTEIEAEIVRLAVVSRDYDTEQQSNDTCLAAGAHDALRWALGLVENSVADGLSEHHPSCHDGGFCMSEGCKGKYKPAVGIVEDTTGVQLQVCQFHYECAIENGWRDTGGPR